MPEQVTITLESVKNFISQLMPKKDLLYIIQPCNIGDVLINGGLSYAVQAKKKQTRYRLDTQRQNEKSFYHIQKSCRHNLSG